MSTHERLSNRSRNVFLALLFGTMFITLCHGCITQAAGTELIIAATTPKEIYHPGELVAILGTVWSSAGTAVVNASVGVQIEDPHNNTVFLDITLSQQDGSFNSSFRLDANSLLGLYQAYISVSAMGYTSARNETQFTVSMVGDLTGPLPFVPDGKVDIRDIAVVAKCFGSAPGFPGWNPNCDVNDDGKVDIRDISIVAKHFGEAAP
jgi:hypothetical protein